MKRPTQISKMEEIMKKAILALSLPLLAVVAVSHAESGNAPANPQSDKGVVQASTGENQMDSSKKKHKRHKKAAAAATTQENVTDKK
jgi:hypothetical protein